MSETEALAPEDFLGEVEPETVAPAGIAERHGSPEPVDLSGTEAPANEEPATTPPVGSEAILRQASGDRRWLSLDAYHLEKLLQMSRLPGTDSSLVGTIAVISSEVSTVLASSCGAAGLVVFSQDVDASLVPPYFADDTHAPIVSRAIIKIPDEFPGVDPKDGEVLIEVLGGNGALYTTNNGKRVLSCQLRVEEMPPTGGFLDILFPQPVDVPPGVSYGISTDNLGLIKKFFGHSVVNFHPGNDIIMFVSPRKRLIGRDFQGREAPVGKPAGMRLAIAGYAIQEDPNGQ